MNIPPKKFGDIELSPIGKEHKTKKPPVVKGYTAPASTTEAKEIAAFAEKAAKTVKQPSILLDQVKRVHYISAEVLKEKLHTGDIFLSYYPTHPEAKDFVIRTGQRLEKLVTRTPTEESHNFIHAALYIGDGKLSEAIAQGVKVSSLEGERFQLKPGMEHGFLVIRPKNEAMAKEAARIAESLSAKNDEKVSLEFSIARAIFSGVRSSVLDEESVKRYLKGSAFAHGKVLPVDKNGVRDFFCSYFVGWVCQAGESVEVLKKVNRELSAKEQIRFPDISKLAAKKQGEVLEKWATKVVSDHYDVLKKHITLDFDPKWTSPQRFYGFVLEHPELFTQEMLIVAPPQEMELEELSTE
jgi:hypothetical protein